jgi:DNA-binding NarL/FixJ family response regulator
VADPADDRITIVIADDHALVRSGLKRLLEEEQDFTVVAEAGDADSALALVGEKRPRVLLVDLKMPGTPSLDAIPSFVSACPGVAVVVVTMYDELEYAREALAVGASAYVLKDAAETQLVEAIRTAVAGRSYLDPGLGARLMTSAPPGRPARNGPPGELAVGATFAGHRVDGIAGRGGMGVVYRATDLTLHRPVALKLIAPSLAMDPVFRARFEQECRLAATIDHPHAVELFHAGEEDGLLYVTMRYIEGTDLRELLKQSGRLEALRATTIVAEVAGALDEAHKHGLVHRDVKPANVLISTSKGRERAFLTDFGVCKQSTMLSELTGTGLAIGSADYMAPEQAHGAAVDGRADIYSLACVLYQALTGAVPYDRDSDLEKLWAHVHDPPPVLHDVRPDLPRRLSDIVTRSMAKDPGDRPPTAGELGREALAAASSSPR